MTLAPDFLEAKRHLADALKALGRHEEAILLYQEALAQDPRCFPAAYNLGNALGEIGRYRSAIAAYETALRIQPDSAEAHNNLAVVLGHWDRREEAIAHHREAIRLKPEFREAHKNLVGALEAEGRIAEARAALRQTAQWEANDPFYELRRANLCPLVCADNAAIDAWRARLEKALDRLAADLASAAVAGAAALNPAALAGAELQPPAGLIYQGRDDRTLKEQFAGIFDRLLARLRPDPAMEKRTGIGAKQGRPPRIGFVVTAGHEGVFLKGMRGLLNELPRAHPHFRITVVCSAPNGEAILRPGIAADRGIEFSEPAGGRAVRRGGGGRAGGGV